MAPAYLEAIRPFCRQDRDLLLGQCLERFPSLSPPLLPADVLDDVLVDVLGWTVLEEELPMGQLAVCDFDRRRIAITTRLLENVRPNTDARALMNSTKAHELGHIRLRHDLELRQELDRVTPDLFGFEPCLLLVTYRDDPEVRPRLSWRHQRRERQADLYASEFLIHEGLLEAREELGELREAVRAGREIDSTALWRMTYSLARGFQVSPTLMKNRLVEMGLVEYRERRLVVSGQGRLEFEAAGP